MMSSTADARHAQPKVCPTDHESLEPVLPRPSANATASASPAAAQDVKAQATNDVAAARGRREQVDKRSFDYLMRSGLAGGLAGCAAKTVVGPLDRVKILFQASNPQFAKYANSWFGLATAMQNIHQQEGVRGLFKGHSATLLRIFPYAAIKFLAYEQIRAMVIPNKNKETPFRRLISGSMAGISSVFSTYPLELIRVRLAFETKTDSRSSLRRICRTIYHEPAMTSTAEGSSQAGGLRNFYRGFGPTMLGMLPYAGMSFLTHDTVGDWLRQPAFEEYSTIPNSALPPSSSSSDSTHTNHRLHRPQLTASAELFSGAVAGLVSQTSSYPLEVIRRRMQVAGAVQQPPPKNPASAAAALKALRPGIVGTAQLIWAERGFRGFFVGLTIGYMKVVPMAATAFFVYERSKWYLGI